MAGRSVRRYGALACLAVIRLVFLCIAGGNPFRFLARRFVGRVVCEFVRGDPDCRVLVVLGRVSRRARGVVVRARLVVGLCGLRVRLICARRFCGVTVLAPLVLVLRGRVLRLVLGLVFLNPRLVEPAGLRGRRVAGWVRPRTPTGLCLGCRADGLDCRGLAVRLGWRVCTLR